MPFKFLTYLQPTHYFRLFIKDRHSVFPKVEELPESALVHLSKDDSYRSPLAKNYDLSWQAIQKGYIGEADTYINFEKLPLSDEYRFIRKNFHQAWVLYTLLIRLLSLKNPIKELGAFFKTRQTQRQFLSQEYISYPSYSNYESSLVASKPLVSIVIPTLNRYPYLKDVLIDLEQQDYKHFEVIVVDQSEPFQKDFYKDFKLDLKLIHQEEKALWLARNTAIKNAKGSIILLSEDDVRINDDWIVQHLKCLDFFGAKVSAGVFYPQGMNIPKDSNYFKLASQFATGNAALYKSVFQDVGLFDRQFEKQRMGDGEFGLRVYLKGIKSISNPLASCIDVKAGSGGLREMGSWDAFRPRKWLDPRPIPSVVYLFRKYHGNKAARLALLKTVPSSIMPYRYKRNSYMMVLGMLISIIISPLVFLQVYKSWSLASKKLQEGAKIEKLM
ncbi:putative glycosyltransferase [Psychroflexus gondwanensis ACAM 44]|uniref:Putative glycosyltransferase n=1 Tax=Psychroflexus gondwanensis ACAM 44 TaxID=1189619 RepID=N1WY68_9FLAO|nr:glycosyltransferase family A protein [Psychroflexus gondwanensis]EMY80828.1 putative glycosyltransferase [Psychroflexus gondwanensis ACAM 44]